MHSDIINSAIIDSAISCIRQHYNAAPHASVESNKGTKAWDSAIVPDYLDSLLARRTPAEVNLISSVSADYEGDEARRQRLHRTVDVERRAYGRGKRRCVYPRTAERNLSKSLTVDRSAPAGAKMLALLPVTGSKR